MRRLLVVLLVAAAATMVVRGALPCEVLELQPDCYVSLYPGPTRDTLDIVRLEGRPVTESTGALLLTTVAVDAEVDLYQWVRGMLSPRISEAPRELLYPETDGSSDPSQHNEVLMRSSQLVATIAALGHLGLDFDQEFDGAEVLEISSPTAVEEDQLQPGDVIVAVDGTPRLNSEAVAEAIQAHEPGDVVQLTVREGSVSGERRQIRVELIANPDAPRQALLGVVLTSALELPVDVHIEAGSIGGPSAGLMFAVSIVDLLEPADLSGGEVVAGTGTIDRSGTVGSIGGIRQKLLGALSRGEDPPASVFLVPRGNLEEARGVSVDHQVMLVPVADLDDAVSALRELREGRRPDGALALGPGGDDPAGAVPAP